jgi:hypothetical protein
MQAKREYTSIFWAASVHYYLLEEVCYSSFFVGVDFLVLPSPSVLHFVGTLAQVSLALSIELADAFVLAWLRPIDVGRRQARDDGRQLVIRACLCRNPGLPEYLCEHKRHCLTVVLDMKHLVDQGEDFGMYNPDAEVDLGLEVDRVVVDRMVVGRLEGDLGMRGLVFGHAVWMGLGEKKSFAGDHLSLPQGISETLALGQNQVEINLFGFVEGTFVVVVVEVVESGEDDMKVDMTVAGLVGQTGSSHRMLDV